MAPGGARTRTRVRRHERTGFVFVKREIALSRQCRDLLTDNSVELIVSSCGVSQESAGHEGHEFSSERGCNSRC